MAPEPAVALTSRLAHKEAIGVEKDQRLAGQITVAEFAEVTFAAILRAVEGRKVPRGPIIFGIIYTPEGLGERFGTESGPLNPA